MCAKKIRCNLMVPAIKFNGRNVLSSILNTNNKSLRNGLLHGWRRRESLARPQQRIFHEQFPSFHWCGFVGK